MSVDGEKLAPLDRILAQHWEWEPEWKERLILRQIRGTRWVVANMEAKTLAVDFTDYTAIRMFKKPPRVFPRDVPSGLLDDDLDTEEDYNPPFDRDDYNALLKEAEHVAVGELIRLGLAPDVTNVVSLPKVGFEGPPRAPSVPEGWVAVVQDSIGGYTAGDQLELDGTEVGIGLEGVRSCSEGLVRFRLMKFEEVGAESDRLRAASSADPRILELRTLPGTGRRGRSWQSIVADCVKEDAPDWPIDGPRVAAEVVETLGMMLKTPTEHSSAWSVYNKLEPLSGAAQQHMGHCEAIQDAALYDQLDIKNTAVLEHCFRNVCLIELEQERRRDARGSEAGDENRLRTSELERGMILGNRFKRPVSVVPPSFRKWLSGELKEEADRQKNERKLREEQTAQREARKKK